MDNLTRLDRATKNRDVGMQTGYSLLKLHMINITDTQQFQKHEYIYTE